MGKWDEQGENVYPESPGWTLKESGMPAQAQGGSSSGTRVTERSLTKVC